MIPVSMVITLVYSRIGYVREKKKLNTVSAIEGEEVGGNNRAEGEQE